MNNASSALSAAGNSLDESIALLAAANVTVQNASKSSTAVRTITARLRNSKAELDDLGEEVMTTAKYQALLNTLTENGVHIVDEATGKYNSTYEIMRQLSEVWGDLSDGIKATLTTQLAGVRNVDVFNSILQNFRDVAVGAMDDMSESANALTDAYSIFQDTTTAHLQSLKAAWQELATIAIDQDFVKDLIDVGKSLVEVFQVLFNLLNKLGGAWTVSAIGAAALVAKFINLEKGIKAFRAAFAVASDVSNDTFSNIAYGAQGLLSSINKVRAGLVAVTAVVGVLSFIAKKAEEARRKTIELGKETTDYRKSLYKIRNEYQSLYESGDLEGIKRLQEEINTTVGEHAENIDLVNGKYDEELNKLKSIRSEAAKNADDQQKIIAAYSTAAEDYYATTNRVWSARGGTGQRLVFDSPQALLTELKEQLKIVQELEKNGESTLLWPSQSKLVEKIDSVTESIENMKAAATDVVEMYALPLVLDKTSDSTFESVATINSFVSANAKLVASEGYVADAMEKGLITIEDIENAIKNVMKLEFPEYADDIAGKVKVVASEFTSFRKSMSDLSESIEALKGSYDLVNKAAKDMVSNDTVSYDTLKALVQQYDNYTDYLYESNGLLKIRVDLLKQEADASYLMDVEQIQKEILSYDRERNAKIAERNELYKAGVDTSAIDAEIDKYTALIGADNDLLNLFDAIYNTVVSSANETVDAVKKEEEAVVSFSDAISELGKNYDILSTARKEMSEDGYLSASTIESIISASEDYIDVLTIENGKIKLNEQAWKEYYTSKYNSAIKELELQKEIVEAELGGLYEARDAGSNNVDDLIKEREEQVKTFSKQIALYDAAVDSIINVREEEENEEEEISLLSDAISELSSNYDILATARKEMQENGKLSVDTIEKIISATDGFTDVLSIENGEIKLNEKAWEEYSNSKYQAAKRDAIVQKTRLESERAMLQEEMKRYAGQAAFMDEYAEKIAAIDLEIGQQDQVINLYDALMDAIVNAADDMDEEADAAETLSDAISDLSKGYDTLSTARKEMRENGQLSLDTIESIISSTENYMDVLSVENGAIKLNEQAWIDSYSAKYDAMRKDVEAQKEALETEKARIETEMSLHAGETAFMAEYAKQLVELGGNLDDVNEKLELFESILRSIEKTKVEQVWDDLSSALSDTAKTHELITAAQDEMNKSGGLTYDTVEGLLSISMDYVKFLRVENGVVKLSAEAMREYADAKAQAQSNALTEEIERLIQERNDLIASGDFSGAAAKEAEIIDLKALRAIYEALGKVTGEVYDYSDAISELTKSHDILRDAQKEMAENGQLSVGTIQSIMDATDNYTDILTVENGIVKLNEEAWIEYYTSKYNAAREEIKVQTDLAKIEQTRLMSMLPRYKEGTKEFEDLVAQIEALGVEIASGTETYDLLGAVIDAVTSDVESSEETLDSYLNSLKESLADVSNTYEALADAQREMSDAGGLSRDTVEKLLSISEDYAQFLTVENGLITLNTEALKDYADAQYAAKITELSGKLADLKTQLSEADPESEISAELEKQCSLLESEIELYQTLFGTLTYGVDIVAETTTFIDDISSSLNNLADVQEIVANGFVVTADKVKALADIFPELFANAESYADGSMRLDDEVVQNFLANRQAEIESSVDAKILDLQAQLEVVKAKKEFVDAEIELAQTAAQSESNINKAVAQYKIENADAVAQTLIDAGVAEAEAYAIAAKSMYDNSFDLDTAIAQAASDIATNYGEAFASAADNSATNATAINTNIDSTTQQAHLAATAVAGIAAGKVQGAAGVIKPGAGGSRKPTHTSSIGMYSDTGTGDVHAMMQGVIQALQQSHISIQPAEFAATYFSSQFSAQSLSDLILDKIPESQALGLLQQQLEGQIAILQSLKKIDLSKFRDKEKTGSSSAGSGGKPSTSSTSSGTEENPFAKMYAEHQHLLAMEQEEVGDYFAWLDKASKEAYEKGWITIEDLRKYEEEVYRGLKEIISDAESAMRDLVEFRQKMLEKEYEDQKQVLQTQLDLVKKFYDEQKEALQKQREEEEYEKEKAEKQKAVSDIEAEIEMLSHDNSAKAQKRLKELMQQLAEAQAEYTEFEQDHAYQLAEDALDAAYEQQTSELQAQIDAIDTILNDPTTLFNQALQDIKDDTGDLYDAMVQFAIDNGEGESTVQQLWENAFIATQDLQTVTSESVQSIEDMLSSLPSDIAALISGVTLHDSTGHGNSGKNPSGGSSGGSGASGGSSGGGGGGGSSSIPVGTAVKATGKAYSTVKGTGNAVDVSGKQLYVAQVWDNAANPYWQGDYTYGVSYTKGGPIVGWVRKDQLSGYAKGTAYATAGMHMVDEKGHEALFISSSGDHYRLLSSGDKVFNAEATDFLYKFANGDKDIFKDLFASVFSKSALNSIANRQSIGDVRMGDIIINGNADKATVSEIRRAQRESVDSLLQQFGRLQRAAR